MLSIRGTSRVFSADLLPGLTSDDGAQGQHKWGSRRRAREGLSRGRKQHRARWWSLGSRTDARPDVTDIIISSRSVRGPPLTDRALFLVDAAHLEVSGTCAVPGEAQFLDIPIKSASGSRGLRKLFLVLCTLDVHCVLTCVIHVSSEQGETQQHAQHIRGTARSRWADFLPPLLCSSTGTA